MTNSRSSLRLAAIAVALLAVLTFSTAASAAIVSGMKPYLMAPNSATNSVYVLLECTTTDTVTVQWGPTTSYGSSATTESNVSTGSSTYVHRVKLTGLTPGALYHYRAGQLGVYSADSTFTAAPSARVQLPVGRLLRLPPAEHLGPQHRGRPGHRLQSQVHGGTRGSLQHQQLMPIGRAIISARRTRCR